MSYKDTRGHVQLKRELFLLFARRRAMSKQQSGPCEPEKSGASELEIKCNFSTIPMMAHSSQLIE